MSASTLPNFVLFVEITGSACAGSAGAPKAEAPKPDISSPPIELKSPTKDECPWCFASPPAASESGSGSGKRVAATSADSNCTTKPSSVSKARLAPSARSARKNGRALRKESRDQPGKSTLDCCSFLASTTSAALMTPRRPRSCSDQTAVMKACPHSSSQDVQKARPRDSPKLSSVRPMSARSSSSSLMEFSSDASVEGCSRALASTDSILMATPGNSQGKSSWKVSKVTPRDARKTS
mmetsp:Transcript_145941/g.254637  ORF Transcript_145941/g.254637 Transcript_145941/m.254637 type:complete len:238 (-) Transcript_145941:858-1571(-)